jgi:hypothetical protein
MNIYQKHGYANRAEYLKELAQEFEPAAVYALADLLGPGEDFDGLITELEDARDMGMME